MGGKRQYCIVKRSYKIILILKISSELMLEHISDLPEMVKKDIDVFIDSLVQDPFDNNSLKSYGLKNEDIIAVLHRVFG